MIEFFKNQQWMIIAVLFFGLLAYVALLRRRDRKWIEGRFGRNPVLAMSFGVNYFGCFGDPGPPGRSSGFLLLMRDRLFYRSRVKRIELDIPARAIFRAYMDRVHKGVDLHQSVMKIDFIDPGGNRNTAAFKVPYPAQWIRAIENLRPGNDAAASQAPVS